MRNIEKKILIVSRTFYPANSPRSFRTTELANEFARMGHAVTILVPKNDDEHFTLEKEYGYTIKDLGSPKYKQINTSPNKHISTILRGLRRLLLLLLEYPEIEYLFKVRKALMKEKGYDLLISIAVPYPIHWGIAWARKKNHSISKIWVADCGYP